MNQVDRGGNCLGGSGSGSRGLLALLLNGGGGLSLGGLLLLGGGRVAGLSLVAVRRCPEGEVVTEELHDEGAVTVGLLGQRVELSNGVVEGLLGEVASTVGRVQDLVVEDREVQRQTQTDGVGGGELGLSNIGGRLGSQSISDLRCRLHHSVIPCKPRVRQWQQPCASRRKRTQRGNGGSHPSYGYVSLTQGWS